MGKLITFEGIDCCGKTTQINLLLDDLTAKYGKSAMSTREPGGCIVAEHIRSILLDPATPPISGTTEALLFAASRSEHYNRIVKYGLEHWDFVISDRFCDSSVAYQGGGRQMDKERIMQINDLFLEGRRPDKTFYIRITPEEMYRRMAERHMEQLKDRIEREDIAFFQRVVDTFDELAEKNPERFVVIDGAQDIQTIHSQICQNLEESGLL